MQTRPQVHYRYLLSRRTSALSDRLSQNKIAKERAIAALRKQRSPLQKSKSKGKVHSMRLPLLLCAAAIALSGCRDGGCTASHCTISSMMGNSQSAAPTYQASTAQSATSPYQAPSTQATSRQSPSPADLSGYGGMYSGVRLPDSSPSTYQSTSRQTSTYQSTAPTPAGFVTPGMVSGGCDSPTAGGKYDPNTNLIHICNVGNPAYRRYIIAHETGHAVDYQQDRKFATDLEYWADQYAVNRLLQEGDCDAIAAYANQSTNSPSPYTPGIHYARQALDHC